jgi:hypothetical protein
MEKHIDKTYFIKALKELGHDPSQYLGKKLTLEEVGILYNFQEDSLIEAINSKILAANYDYQTDKIWIDALEAAHFHFCVMSV